MNSTQWLQMIVEQTWQVAVLASLVWLILRVVGRDRAHLAHLLWALVLVKCLTPPLWSAPFGFFGHVKDQLVHVCGFGESSTTSHSQSSQEWNRSQDVQVQVGHGGIARGQATPRLAEGYSKATWWRRVQETVLIGWFIGSILMLSISFLRVVLFLRVVARRSCKVSPAVAQCVASLN